MHDLGTLIPGQLVEFLPENYSPSLLPLFIWTVKKWMTRKMWKCDRTSKPATSRQQYDVFAPAPLSFPYAIVNSLVCRLTSGLSLRRNGLMGLYLWTLGATIFSSLTTWMWRKWFSSGVFLLHGRHRELLHFWRLSVCPGPDISARKLLNVT